MADKKHKHAGHGFHRVSIEHHKDGSHTVHHQHSDGAHADVKHAAADLNAVHDSMEDHLGAPNPGEGAADMGQHGIPAEAAGAAGIPMPPAPAPAM